MTLQPTISRQDDLRQAVTKSTCREEDALFEELKKTLAVDDTRWMQIESKSIALIDQIRAQPSQPLIDQFLSEYDLSTDEGIRLMRLAEALSRTTDPITANELISDKITNGDWLLHAKPEGPWLIRMAGYGMAAANRWLGWSTNQTSPLTLPIAKTGNAFLRWATRTAIRALSSQFVFAENISAAMKRAARYGKNGYLFSFDMLGEAARTQADADRYLAAYDHALDTVIQYASSDDPLQNHGISIKLSALHPRYEFSQAEKAVPEIVSVLLPLLQKARKANVQITIDAEEAERLDISMDVLSTSIAKPELRGWRGFGFVVQAYQRRALPLLDWLEAKSVELGAPIVIRLVKGAYWDSEIKRAQEMGLESYPVYTRKEMTDLSYLACAQKLLSNPAAFNPQFATHNAHSIAAVRELAGEDRNLEVQRLFGMGQQLHDILLKQPKTISRIYAPVGTQKDLLSYLIRRLLENGANSSFVRKLSDKRADAKLLSANPSDFATGHNQISNEKIPAPRAYLRGNRETAIGWDISNPDVQQTFETGLADAHKCQYLAGPLINGNFLETHGTPVRNPAKTGEIIGHCHLCDEALANAAIEAAKAAHEGWGATSVEQRAIYLNRAAQLLENRASIFHYLAIKEAGKTWNDAVDEVREAVDFCRYYADQAADNKFSGRQSLGVVTCISPWNFPLAIFLGQVTAALAAGNTVVAKPAEQTPLIACEAVRLLHDAGIPPGAVNIVPGEGAIVGETLVSNADGAAVCFTGSTATAKRIAKRLADTGRLLTPLIAETGGINAMIVDSSALLEQTVDDVVSSAFQSAGQRCSALRILCVQEDIADEFTRLLQGAMKELKLGDPALLRTDIGPVIDANAKSVIESHVGHLKQTATLVGQAAPGSIEDGYFVPPVALELAAFSDLDREIFGPILHIIRFEANEKSNIIRQINASGYGLTLGIQSRIDTVADKLAADANVGNIYINRNQIGAVVGVQPFGGQGLSGTGPKAGGPLYLLRLSQDSGHLGSTPSEIVSDGASHSPVSNILREQLSHATKSQNEWHQCADQDAIIHRIASALPSDLAGTLITEIGGRDKILDGPIKLSSPSGETNLYRNTGRGLIISTLQNPQEIVLACFRALVTGNGFFQLNEGEALTGLKLVSDAVFQSTGLRGLVSQSQPLTIKSALKPVFEGEIGALIVDPTSDNLADIGTLFHSEAGAILPALTIADTHDRYVHEKTVTRNIAAAGGDVALLNG